MSFVTPPALLLIDIQKGLDECEFYGGKRNNPNAEENAAALLAHWRSRKLPVFHVMHSSQNPESPLHHSKSGFEIKEIVKPLAEEPVIVKDVNSAFIGTDLLDQLQKVGASTVVIVGLTTNHCISSSARMSANLGLKTIVISDATATFDRTSINGQTIEAEMMHQTALASLQHEFATIMDSQELLTRLEN